MRAIFQFTHTTLVFQRSLPKTYFSFSSSGDPLPGNIIDIVWKIILEGKRFFFGLSFDLSDFVSSSPDELFSLSSWNECISQTQFQVLCPTVISHTYQILDLVRNQSFDQFQKCLIVDKPAVSVAVYSAFVIFDQFLDKRAILFENFVTHIWDVVKNCFIFHLQRIGNQ